MEHFANLVAENHERLVGWLMKRTGNYHVAQDLAQEVYVKLLRNGAAQVIEQRALLFEEAKHQAWDHLRRESKRRDVIGLDEFHSVPDPHDRFEVVEVRQELQVHLQQMSDEDRRIFVLTADGYTGLEIGNELALTVGQVKKRIHNYRVKIGKVKKTDGGNIRLIAKRVLSEEKRITTERLAEAAGCSEQLAYYHLCQMEQKGYIVTCGAVTNEVFSLKGKPRWVYAATSKLRKVG